MRNIGRPRCNIDPRLSLMALTVANIGCPGLNIEAVSFSDGLNCSDFLFYGHKSCTVVGLARHVPLR